MHRMHTCENIHLRGSGRERNIVRSQAQTLCTRTRVESGISDDADGVAVEEKEKELKRSSARRHTRVCMYEDYTGDICIWLRDTIFQVC